MKRLLFFIVVLFSTFCGFAQEHFVVAFSDDGQDHMNIYVVSATINGIDLQANDEIATFDGTICCGKTILKQPIVISVKNSFAILKASRNDDNESNGYTTGNAIKFRIWDSDKKIELSGITAEFINPVDGKTITPPTYTPGETAFVKLSVIVAAGNKTPESKAGDDQTVNEGEKVTLNGAGSSDEDGDTIDFLWTAPSGITLNSVTTANPTFIAPEVKSDTSFSFFLIVNDGTLNSTADEVVVKIKNVNKVPIAKAGIDQTVTGGDTVTFDGTGSSDPDGDSIFYSWISHPGITLSSTTAAKPTFIAPVGNLPESYFFMLIVSDGVANSITDTVQITVKLKNRQPIANAGIDQILDENKLCTLDGSGSSDPDGNLLTYLWTPPVGIILNSNTAEKPTFNVPEIKKDTFFIFSLVVNDGSVNSEPSTVKVSAVNVIKTTSALLNNNEIKIYPNPSKGILRIEGLEPNRLNNFKIFSIDGKLILQKKSRSEFEEIDLSRQVNGKYLIFINSKPFKILKQ